MISRGMDMLDEHSLEPIRPHETIKAAGKVANAKTSNDDENAEMKNKEETATEEGGDGERA